jgi:hypothetical protein
MKAPNIIGEPGWQGAFTRDQAEGALPNGATIVKDNSESNDATPNGTRGIILGSFAVPDPVMAAAVPFFYFVEWSNRPRIAIGCVSTKIQALQ